MDCAVSEETSQVPCHVCRQLNVERLASPERTSHHATLLDLALSAKACRLCKLIISELLDSKKTSLTFRRLLRSDENLRHISAHLELAKENNRVHIQTRLAVKETNRAANWDHWETEAVENTSVSLQVWTVEDDPALAYGLPWRRPLTSSTSSAESMEVARGWLNDCIKHHVNIGACSFDSEKSRYGGSQRPTRLIDLSRGLSDLRLVAGNEADGAYVALSYVWGSKKPTWKTIRDDLDRRALGFDMKELPQTLCDAIKVTQALGLEFCWIDALCIVQNDAEEWERESVKMDVIYSSAAVTLMASASNGSTEGLFNETSSTCDGFESHGVMMQSELSDGQCSTLLLSRPPQHGSWLEMALSAETTETTLFERGWCFQEWMLSPRKLYFGSSQLFWECSRGCLSEDGLWTYQQHHRGLTQALMSYVEGLGPINKKLKSWSMAMNMLWYYDSVSQSYSDRKLTNQSDRLIAISGLAKMMQIAVPSKYLAGIWEHSLPGGLCWRRVSAGGKCADYVAPSWSWASQDAMVEYMIEPLDPKTKCSPCEVISSWIKTNSGDEMGLAVAGRITLRAPTFQGRVGMTISSRTGGYYNVDDDPPLEHILYPDQPSPELMRFYVQGLVMDEDKEVEDIPVSGMIMYDDKEKEQVGILVVRRTKETDHQRVGFLWTKLSEEQRSKLHTRLTTLTIS
ncbi:hypothetical protein AC579_6427 [Pseudocercospora musae]|uniref:Heterokaryon incompatibility domain-containing protein n=1 Tax=Pseudocercospora musae TaxID=113226 RepID=A0A139I229_9PEZI|nr:hypothetical protein AC579_6427 [Pseudocercospora musae]